MQVCKQQLERTETSTKKEICYALLLLADPTSTYACSAILYKMHAVHSQQFRVSFCSVMHIAVHYASCMH
jgi:hypothetical protein